MSAHSTKKRSLKWVHNETTSTGKSSSLRWKQAWRSSKRLWKSSLTQSLASLRLPPGKCRGQIGLSLAQSNSQSSLILSTNIRLNWMLRLFPWMDRRKKRCRLTISPKKSSLVTDCSNWSISMKLARGIDCTLLEVSTMNKWIRAMKKLAQKYASFSAPLNLRSAS